MRQKGFIPIVVVLIGEVIVAVAFFTPYFQNKFKRVVQNTPSPLASPSTSTLPKTSSTQKPLFTITPQTSPIPSNSPTSHPSPNDLIPMTGKPVIYLYPTQIQKTIVKLFFNGSLIQYTTMIYKVGKSSPIPMVR